MEPPLRVMCEDLSSESVPLDRLQFIVGCSDHLTTLRVPGESPREVKRRRKVPSVAVNRVPFGIAGHAGYQGARIYICSSAGRVKSTAVEGPTGGYSSCPHHRW